MADPVSIFVQPIVEKIYDTALSLIKEEFLAVHGVKKDVEKLLSTLKTIQVVLEDAEERQVNDGPVGHWLSKLKLAAYDADDILDTFATETFLWQRKQQVSRIRAPIGLSMLSTNFSVAHKIKKISEKLDAIAKEKNDYNLTARLGAERILKDMIEFHTNMEYSDNVSQSILESRFLEFLAGKKILLVLDDVWTEVYDEWEGLRKLLRQGGQGSRILVTTRSNQVSAMVGTQPAYELKVLPEEECWSLFKKIAFNDCSSMGGNRKELEAIGREIVGKCNQLPLAVKAMGGLLCESRHISLLGQDIETPTLQIIEKSNRLRTFLLPGESSRSLGHMLDKMFHSLSFIRVLDLSSSLLSELPSSIEKLKLLRYLDLSRTEIKVLPNSICNLCNLQTLKLLGCLWLFELPEGLGKMVNLRYLELDEMFWFKCRMLPPRMGNLTSLQNLHAFPVSGTSGHGIEELKDMANLTGTLHISKLENAVNAADAKLKEKETLQKLVLEWSDKDFNQQEEDRAARNLEDLQPHSNLEELALHHFKGSSFPLWMTDGLLQNLVTLSLIHCTKCTTISVGLLPCLRKLCIKGMLELEEWPEDQCLPLGRLQISNCPKLRRVPNWMPNLGVLKIKKCDSLKALPTAPSLTFLILIDNLVMEDWHERMCIIAQDDQGNLVGQPRPTLIGLLELKVVNCPNIQALPQIFAPQKLEISRCGRITALPLPEFSIRLQHLALDKCYNGTLVRAIQSTNSLYSLVISNISNVTSFPKLPHLPGLKSLYISDCKDLTSLSEEEGSLKSLSSLQLLSVRGCSKLESLPDEGLPAALECLIIDSCPILKVLGSKDTLKSLLSLKDLYLEDCPKIQSFPDGGLPSSLIHLEIHGCPLLLGECQKEDVGGTEWPKIMHVTDREFDSIKLPSAPVLQKKKRWTPLIGCSKG
ncbi:Disease resistance protein [Corchorus olitorius]|uniref:Disease resistance protein n=1 Tax=Corchorus olitorius TaxID=93759 RepID=A0A1R3H0A0_9ROSI|nr:Disease resistance protein [Corchorus olitorius]